MFVESIDEVKIIITKKEETLYPFYLFLLERNKTSGKYIIPGFEVEDIPSNINVKSEQSFLSFCKYFIQNKMIDLTQTQTCSFHFEKMKVERNIKTIFVTFSQNESNTMFKKAYCFTLLSEIVNERKIFNDSICESVTELFTRNFSDFLIQDDKVNLPYPLPYALYKSAIPGMFYHLPLEREKNNKFIFSFYCSKASLRFAVFLENFSSNERNNNNTYFSSNSEIEVNERNQFSLLSIK